MSNFTSDMLNVVQITVTLVKDPRVAHNTILLVYSIYLQITHQTKCNIHIEYGQKSASPNRITEPSAVVQAVKGSPHRSLFNSEREPTSNQHRK